MTRRMIDLSASARHPVLRVLDIPAVLFVLPPLFWSGNLVIGRAVSGDIPPITLNFLRWVLALALLLPFTASGLVRARAVLRQGWAAILVCGVAGVTILRPGVR